MRSLRVIGRAILIAAALLVLLAAGLGARLAFGPIALDGLVSILQARFSAAVPGHTLAVDGVALAWDGAAGGPVIRSSGVSVRDADGAAVARFPAVDLKLDATALPGGRLVFDEVVIRGATAALVRGDDGRIGLADAEGDRQAAIDRAVRAALEPAAGVGIATGLRTLSLVDATVTLHAPSAGRRLVLAVPAATLAVGDAGLLFRFTLLADPDGTRGGLRGTVRYPVDGGAVDLAVMADGLRPELLADFVPALAPAAGADLPISGGVRLRLAADGRVGPVDFALTGGPGRLSLAGLGLAGIPVRAIRADGAWDDTAGTLALTEGRLALGPDGGPEVSVEGRATVDVAGVTVDGEVAVRTLAAADLGAYWPAAVAADARAWVSENITAGVIDRASFRLAAAIPAGEPATLDVHRLDGTFAYRGLAVHYLRPMPPVSGLAGTATVTPAALTFIVARGEAPGLAIGDGEVVIRGLDGPDQRLAVRVDVSGAVPEWHALLTHPRLGIGLAQLGREQVGGHVAARLTVALPLERDVAAGAVDIGASGTVTDGTLEGLLPGLQVTDAALTLDLGSGESRIHGPLTVNGAPARIDWRERPAPQGGSRRTVRAHVEGLGDAGRAALGLALDPYVSGPVTLDVTADLTQADTGTAAVDADLTAATVAIPEVGWRKRAGTPGRVAADLSLAAGRLANIPRISGDVAGLRFDGAIGLDADGRRLRRVSLSRLVLDDTALRDVVVERTGSGIVASAGGGTVDATRLLSVSSDASGFGSVAVTAPALERIRLRDGRSLRDARVRLVRAGGIWRELDVAGTLHAGRDDVRLGAVEFYVGPPAGGRQPVEARAEAVGELLAGLGVAEGLSGGTMRFDGTTAGGDILDDIGGTVVVEGLTVLPASIGGRALQAAARSGEDSTALVGEGPTVFEHIGATGHRRGSVVTIDALTAYRSSLGVRAAGTVDLETRAVAMQGKVIPLRRLSAAVGRVPIVGGLLTGGGGLIAVDVDIGGTIETPTFETRLLRTLTPNLLAPFEALMSVGRR